MRATIESTEQIVELASSGPLGALAEGMRKTAGLAQAQARVWVGTTETGVPVQMLVVRVAVRTDQPAEVFAQFERELEEKPAARPDVPAFPLRMIL